MASIIYHADRLLALIAPPLLLISLTPFLLSILSPSHYRHHTLQAGNAMGTGRAATGKKRGGGGGSVSEAAALAKSKAGPEGVLTALSSIKPEELQHVMEEIETEVGLKEEGRERGCSSGRSRWCLNTHPSLPLLPSLLPNQMHTRAKRLRLEAEEHALSLQNAFHVELMKLPKSVRAMSLREFSEQYGEVREEREGGRKGGKK